MRNRRHQPWVEKTLLFATVGLLGCSGNDPAHVVPDAAVEAPEVAFACGGQTCGGCCDANRCRGGTQEEACGSGGAPCVACGTDSLCRANACVPLDPNRYAAVPDGGLRHDGGVPPTGGAQRCGFLGGHWICW